MLLGLPAVAHTNAVRILKSGVAYPAGRVRSDARPAWTRSSSSSMRVATGRSPGTRTQCVRRSRREARAFYDASAGAPGPFQLTAARPWARRASVDTGAGRRAGDRALPRHAVGGLAVPQLRSFLGDEPWIGSARASPACRRGGVSRPWIAGGNTTPLDPPRILATLLVASTNVRGRRATLRRDGQTAHSPGGSRVSA